MDDLPTSICASYGTVRFRFRNDFMVGFYGDFYRFFSIRFLELYRDGFKPQNKGNVNDTLAFDYLGPK